MSRFLETDAYKFSMATAGFPLRTENFYYTHRKSGPHFLPFNTADLISKLNLLPQGPSEDDQAFLAKQGLLQGSAAIEAFTRPVEIHSIPEGTWFFDREPVFSVRGPSSIVSWLEPLLLQLHYRIQVATAALLFPKYLSETISTVTCMQQKEIVQETLDSIRFRGKIDLSIEEDAYTSSVYKKVRALIEVVEDPSRIFEVGMRSAVCPAQHEQVIVAAKAAGLTMTSNVHLARKHGLRPVGTMGHEHIQRNGSDALAFESMRDRVPGSTSFLLDTYSTIHSGIPAAFKLIAEDPTRRDFVRFDSGDKRTQFIYAVSKARAMGISPRFILEDSLNLELTQEFEELRKLLKVPASDVIYGFGGHLVNDGHLTRDRVAAVYKLSKSGRTPTMKFGDEPGSGKESIPGLPVLYRTRLGSSDHLGDAPTGVVAQEGETVSPDLIKLTKMSQVDNGARFTVAEVKRFWGNQKLMLSPETTRLVKTLRATRVQDQGSL